MIPRCRRYLPLFVFLFLATPLLVGLISPQNEQEILKEGRARAPAPSFPRDVRGFVTLSKQVDGYLGDRFGLRKQMVGWYSNLRKSLFAEGNDRVLLGERDRLFYLGDSAVLQSAGLVRRDSRVTETADFLAAMRDALSERGIKFLVALPPNASTIYQDDLPSWARSNGRTTEYDLFVADLAARSVETIDLRPIMSGLRKTSPAYLLHDTHWTPQAAIAAFNAIAEADGHREWLIDPNAALGPWTQRQGGDLARMLGVSDDVAEPTRTMTFPAMSKVELTAPPFASYVATRDKPGKTVMIIGDSFTMDYFAPMLLKHVGRVVWQYYLSCGFDWNLIDRFQPDEVWWTPTERSLVCLPNVRPEGFPSAPQTVTR